MAYFGQGSFSSSRDLSDLNSTTKYIGRKQKRPRDQMENDQLKPLTPLKLDSYLNIDDNIPPMSETKESNRQHQEKFYMPPMESMDCDLNCLEIPPLTEGDWIPSTDDIEMNALETPDFYQDDAGQHEQHQGTYQESKFLPLYNNDFELGVDVQSVRGDIDTDNVEAVDIHSVPSELDDEYRLFDHSDLLLSPEMEDTTFREKGPWFGHRVQE